MINELAFLTDERQLTSRVIKSPCQNTHLHIARNWKCYHIFRNIKPIFSFDLIIFIILDFHQHYTTTHIIISICNVKKTNNLFYQLITSGNLVFNYQVCFTIITKYAKVSRRQKILRNCLCYVLISIQIP